MLNLSIFLFKSQQIRFVGTPKNLSGLLLILSLICIYKLSSHNYSDYLGKVLGV
ncbi:hypothetical protein [Nostoc sp. FACHB-133]|uniref:hypothetical protein n=1 Tax=Nostoc sp. FACHB-133 TaxID=2692835 RepID=UPI00168267BB|nr:hypothetical protein [Nostoc sp. FACHB-133]MBD2526636.1 hypothetical protein [Nostoc sp. FACHB-133]